MRYYLAHPAPDMLKVRKWQQEAEEELGKVFVNPFYDIEKLNIGSEGELAEKGEQINGADVDEKNMVQVDLEGLDRALSMIAIITGALSIGTFQEIVYDMVLRTVKKFGVEPRHFIKALLSTKPRALIVVEDGRHNHPWLRFHAKKIFRTREELLKYMKENPDEGVED